MGSWFGQGQQQQQPSQPAPYTRYGRVLKSSTDRLFGFSEGSWQCEIGPGAVILAAHPRRRLRAHARAGHVLPAATGARTRR
jgi:hypothetical protein